MSTTVGPETPSANTAGRKALVLGSVLVIVALGAGAALAGVEVALGASWARIKTGCASQNTDKINTEAERTRFI